MKNETLIIENLKSLSKDIRDLRSTVPRLARIEEHLVNLNGVVQKNEKNISILDTRCDNEDKRIDKIYTIAGVISATVGTLVGIIVAFINKIFR